jgi:AcrR family transcriptional regulator
MFKPEERDAAKIRVFNTALALFREKGFNETTMREVAKESGLSLGAAYYYFRSKEDIVAAYYEHVQSEHVRLAREGFAGARSLKQRLEVVFHSKLDIIANDRRLLVALFRYGGDSEHPLSWFGPETQRQRDLSMSVFDEALGDEKLPADLRDAVPVMLWAMHMGLMLYMLFDGSPQQQQTRKLADHAIPLSLQMLKLVRVPLVRSPIRKSVTALKEAGLLPDAERWRKLLAAQETV